MKLMILLSLIILMSGCASTGLFSETGLGLVTVSKEGRKATTAIDTSKTGMACSHNILGIAAFGNSSIAKAKLDGKISSVSTVDKKFLNILSIYGRVCTVVTGG